MHQLFVAALHLLALLLLSSSLSLAHARHTVGSESVSHHGHSASYYYDPSHSPLSLPFRREQRRLALAHPRSSSEDSLVVPTDDPDNDRDVPQLITSKGYQCEIHSVQTSDGFVLGVQRIPSGRSSKPGVVNPIPVILMHGLLDSSAAFVINSAQQSLAYILADSGFDVWMINTRGNYYSREHVDYTPDQPQFWEFSFDEMAAFDVPAAVDYVLQATNSSSVAWVGHSQGTVQMFAALSTQPELNKKINLFVALAPVTYVSNQNSVIFGALAKFKVDQLVEKLGLHEFLPSQPWIHQLAKTACGSYPEVCEEFLFLLCGPNPTPGHNLNITRLPVYMMHAPAGTSVRNMVHWATHVRIQNRFARYDYGSDAANMQHYNSTTPPDYDLSQITTNVALFTGSNDALADPTDVAYMKTKMNPSVIVHHDNQADYEHLDFTWGVDDYLRIYPNLLTLLRQYSNANATVTDTDLNAVDA